MPSELPAAPAILCKPFLVEFETLEDRLRAFGGDVRDAVDDLTPEPLPDYQRLAQQQFLECLDAMSWRHRSEAHVAARAMFDRLFWSWRGEDFQIVELDRVPFALDSAWSPPTVKLFGDLWRQLAPAFDDLREPFEVAASNGELVGRFEDFVGYARAWGEILARGADEAQGLLVVQFDSPR
jgi:hypothetical protein